MSILDNIPVHIPSSVSTADRAYNTLPLLHEIRHALERLSREGESTILDLRAIPFPPGDEQRLLDYLGTGEVEAQLHALGNSLIRETRYSGVWVVEHKNGDDERVALQIEITSVPAILRAQPEDIEEGLNRISS